MDPEINSNVKLYLAPMEGITHAAFREQICSLSEVDYCVTEFMRVTNQLHPKKVFHRYCPELFSSKSLVSNPTISSSLQGPLVANKTPIIVQFLGSNKEALLANAHRAIELGAKGIDLNFGCPAKTVNRNQGGAYLLQFPELIAEITSYLRKGLPKEISVSAKIRLGYIDTSLLKDIVSGIDTANLDWLTVHCRTKKNGYAPPAFWEYLPQIKEWTKTKVIANGDIFSVTDLQKCYSISHCKDFMIGRGVIFNPFLFIEINKFLTQKKINEPLNSNDIAFFKQPLAPKEVLTLLVNYFELSEKEVNGYYATAKVKGWLKTISIKNSLFKHFFDKMKTLKYPQFQAELYKEYHEANS
ncbi:MAG: tRNA-dihydrouridine synthase family protein [Bdellovibrionaceae bacterium]|nr:tRNA-dihydrouridine synthase family protein [Pseudobdellovibrionaceae bacterium]NUM58319.1 tRNA-dihydrouridine synthase family protein [Pseudobdellovibrionaceae bacterium]